MKLPPLDQRLAALADLVRPGDKVADIGCDHGYLGIYLLLAGISPQVWLSDLRPRPLDRARNTAKQYGVCSGVQFVLADGLDGIPSQADTMVFAGMGGELIASLLHRAPWPFHVGQRVVAQPMTHREDLRTALAGLGFETQTERPVFEKDHAYTVLAADYTGTPRQISPLEAVVGRIDLSTDPGRRYLQLQIDKYQAIVEGLQRSVGNPDRLRQMKALLCQLRNL